MVETNYQNNVGSLIILWLGEGLTTFNKDYSGNFCGENKVKWSFLGCLVLESTQKLEANWNPILVDVLFLESKLVSNILWLKYTLSDTPFRFTLKFYFILQISFWVHCFPELYFMRAKRVSAVIEAALDDITSCKTSYSVLSHSHVMMWALCRFVFFKREGGWVILWVLQKRHSRDILSQWLASLWTTGIC